MTKSVAKKIAHNIDDALDDLIREMRKAGESIGDDAKENFTAAAEKLRNAAEVFVDEARRQSKHLSKDVVKEVKKHPVETAAIAAAAAALVGLLIARRSQQSA